MRARRNKERKKAQSKKKNKKATEASDRDGGASGTELSHFHSQSVVKLVSLSEQTVPAQWLLPLNSPFHGCEMEEEVLPLRNMKVHFTWQSPSGSLPVHTYCQNIDLGGGHKLFLTQMYRILCPFELSIVHKGGLWMHPQVFSTRFQRSYL